MIAGGISELKETGKMYLPVKTNKKNSLCVMITLKLPSSLLLSSFLCFQSSVLRPPPPLSLDNFLLCNVFI